MKYIVNDNEDEVLPNILGIKTQQELQLSEFEGFLQSETVFTEQLTAETKFTSRYIKEIHSAALGHLYTFAGKYRDVNVSKGGFLFPTARFLPSIMDEFDNEILSILPNTYTSSTALIKAIAIVHAELLFIHPFREGNGRTARILANLMSRKHGFGPLKFQLITDPNFRNYVTAVQAAADKDYSKMESIIRLIFPA